MTRVTLPTFSAVGSLPFQPMAFKVRQLGQATRVDPQTGFIYFNMPLIQSLVQQGPAVITPLARVIASPDKRLQLLEALYLAQKLAEANIPNAKELYGAASKWNNTTDTVIQVYLSGFYRHIDEPATYGPTWAMMMREQQKSPYQRMWERQQTGLDPLEELGGTLQVIMAREMVRQQQRLYGIPGPQRLFTGG